MIDKTKTREEIEAELGRKMNPAEVYTWLAASLMNKNDRACELLLEIYEQLAKWLIDGTFPMQGDKDLEHLDVKIETMILELGGKLPRQD